MASYLGGQRPVLVMATVVVLGLSRPWRVPTIPRALKAASHPASTAPRGSGPCPRCALMASYLGGQRPVLVVATVVVPGLSRAWRASTIPRALKAASHLTSTAPRGSGPCRRCALMASYLAGRVCANGGDSRCAWAVAPMARSHNTACAQGFLPSCVDSPSWERAMPAMRLDGQLPGRSKACANGGDSRCAWAVAPMARSHHIAPLKASTLLPAFLQNTRINPAATENSLGRLGNFIVVR